MNSKVRRKRPENRHFKRLYTKGSISLSDSLCLIIYFLFIPKTYEVDYNLTYLHVFYQEKKALVPKCMSMLTYEQSLFVFSPILFLISNNKSGWHFKIFPGDCDIFTCISNKGLELMDVTLWLYNLIRIFLTRVTRNQTKPNQTKPNNKKNVYHKQIAKTQISLVKF